MTMVEKKTPRVSVPGREQLTGRRSRGLSISSGDTMLQIPPNRGGPEKRTGWWGGLTQTTGKPNEGLDGRRARKPLQRHREKKGRWEEIGEAWEKLKVEKPMVMEELEKEKKKKQSFKKRKRA